MLGRSCRNVYGLCRMQAPMGVRFFGSTSPDSHQSFLERAVERLNGSIAASPTITGLCFIGADIGTVGLTYGVLSALDVSVTAEFALAFALSRPFRRLRLPLEVILAEQLGKWVPALKKVRISQVFGGRKESSEQVASKSTLSEVMDAMEPMKRVHKDPKRAFHALGEAGMVVMDRLGIAYTLASRILGVGVVTGLYGALSAGVDVQSTLEGWGVGGVGEVAGVWAAAVVGASVLYPASLLGVAGIAPIIVQRVKK